MFFFPLTFSSSAVNFFFLCTLSFCDYFCCIPQNLMLSFSFSLRQFLISLQSSLCLMLFRSVFLICRYLVILAIFLLIFCSSIPLWFERRLFYDFSNFTFVNIVFGGGNSNLFQYSCLENSMDRGAWQTTVHGVTKHWRQPSD